MTSLSGGLVYEYSQEEADYGLVLINSNGSVTLRQDFDNLQNQFNQLNLSLIESTNPSSINIKPPQCGSSLITASQFSKNFTLPIVCPGCQDLVNNGIQNPKNGKLVDVSKTKPDQPVYGSNGQQVQNLELTKVPDDGSNTPNGQNSTPSGRPSGSGTGSAASPSPTKGAAGRTDIDKWLGLYLSVIAMMMTTMLW